MVKTKTVLVGWRAAPLTAGVETIQELSQRLKEEAARLDAMVEEGFELNLEQSPTDHGACLLELHTSDRATLAKYKDDIIDEMQEDHQSDPQEFTTTEEEPAPGMTVQELLNLIHFMLEHGAVSLKGPVRVLKFHAGCEHVEEFVATTAAGHHYRKELTIECCSDEDKRLLDQEEEDDEEDEQDDDDNERPFPPKPSSN